ncbi:MAG TPA: DUF3096 domain-containing protein, partial [Rhizomicrobium sp.]
TTISARYDVDCISNGSISMDSVNILIVQPLIALIFGILILFLPRLLNYFVAVYLIIIGLIGLWPQLFHGSIP